MKTELISTVFLSEKRKKTLLMLMDGPATIDEIKSSLTGTASAIMAQIKILIEQGLIEQKGDKYQLTHTGKIILIKIKPLVETLNVLERNKGYWDSRDLSAIPEDFLYRIGDLGEVNVLEPDLNHLFEPPEELSDSIRQSKKVQSMFTFFCPACPIDYSELAEKNIQFELLITRSVHKRFEEDYKEQYDTVMEAENSNVYVCEDDALKIGALSVTDDLVHIALFTKEGTWDHKKAISYNVGARQWCSDLFETYKKNTEMVK
ncbi:winged helix-turn-helix domain-containing protein [Methanolobus sp. ZRKC3]|uniref:helix-turn-helix transcriptional regulator n=1 Tax=Methanolobus sp. ZRKC3 TaxID=3125786 RepID=UPI003245CE56